MQLDFVASAAEPQPVVTAASAEAMPTATPAEEPLREPTTPTAMVAAPAPAAEVAEIKAVSAPVAPATVEVSSGGRATNDPRRNPRNASVVEVKTDTVQLSTLTATPAQPDPNRAQPTRASNDPRQSRENA